MCNQGRTRVSVGLFAELHALAINLFKLLTIMDRDAFLSEMLPLEM
jgi:hypothetical protein